MATLTWEGFGVPKRGHSRVEYEDAFAGDGAAGRFAVADGASESSYAGPWAKLVVEEFVRQQGADAWLPSARQRWLAMFDKVDLPWFAQPKFEQGAFATWLGLTLEPDHGAGAGGGWAAWAVGDSCLFHMRGDRMMQSFPCAGPADFGNQPQLICSRPRPGKGPKPLRQRIKGSWQGRDRFLLMTDALALWFVEQSAAGQKPWQALEGVASENQFVDLIESLRDRHALRNDDVSLLIVRGL